MVINEWKNPIYATTAVKGLTHQFSLIKWWMSWSNLYSVVCVWPHHLRSWISFQPTYAGSLCKERTIFEDALGGGTRPMPWPSNSMWRKDFSKNCIWFWMVNDSLNICLSSRAPCRSILVAPVAETGFSHRLTAYKIVGHFFGLSYRKISGHNQVKNIFFRISNISVLCPHAQLRGRTVIKKLWTFFWPWCRDRSQSPPCWIFRIKQIHQSTASERTTRLVSWQLVVIFSHLHISLSSSWYTSCQRRIEIFTAVILGTLQMSSCLSLVVWPRYFNHLLHISVTSAKLRTAPDPLWPSIYSINSLKPCSLVILVACTSEKSRSAASAYL